jgi:hypothetical protein
MYDEVSSTPPTSMDSPRIAIPTSQELGMAMLGGCIEVGGEGDTLLYIPWSGRMVIPSNSCMDEITNLRDPFSEDWGGVTPTNTFPGKGDWHESCRWLFLLYTVHFSTTLACGYSIELL